MKLKHILLFCISLQCASLSVLAQETPVSIEDSISKETKYGIRIGADLAKPIRSLLEDDYSGFEIMGDFRITKKFYIAAEIGMRKKINSKLI